MNEVAPIPRGALAAIGRQTALEAKGDIKTFFAANRHAIAGLVAGKMDVDRLMLIAHTAIRNSPNLAKCTVKSLFGATVVAGLMRLEPNTPSGDLHFIPRQNKGQWEVNIQIGYKGRRVLALRSPMIRDLSTHVVHVNDRYRVIEGSNPRIDHEPLMTGPRGDPLFYYARAQLRSGSVVFAYMTVEDIDLHRNRYSDAYKSALGAIARAEREGNAGRANYIREHTPWIAQLDSMSRKTVLIKLCTQQLPIDTAEQALADAIDREDRRQNLGKVLDMESLEDLTSNPPVEDFDQGDEEDDRTIDIVEPPPRSRPKAVENITETITHVEQREPEPAPKAAPQAAKKPAPREAEVADQRYVPWYEVLGLTGRAFTAAQRAMEQHNIDSIESARLFDWRRLDKVGPTTLTELRTALGVPEPEAEPEVKEAPKPVVKAPAKPADRPALQRAPAPVSPPPADDELGWGDVE